MSWKGVTNTDNKKIIACFVNQNTSSNIVRVLNRTFTLLVQSMLHPNIWPRYIASTSMVVAATTTSEQIHLK